MAEEEKSATTSSSSTQRLWDYWNDEIKDAQKALESWHALAEECEARYLDEDIPGRPKNRLNIYPTNIDILQAGLLMRNPLPTATRRRRSAEDQPGRVAALMLQNVLHYEVETDEYYGNVLQLSTQDYLVTGLGAAWVRYDLEEEGNDFNDWQISADAEDQAEVMATPETDPVLASENTPIDHVRWNNLLWSVAESWPQVWWMAKRVFMKKTAIKKRFGEEAANAIYGKLHREHARSPWTTGDKKVQKPEAEIYEIWDKNSKKVFWFSPDYEKILAQKKDPLGLPGFFPTKRPMFANTISRELIPQPDYSRSKQQYDELDQVNARISLLLKALAVKGVYNGAAEGVKSLINAKENMLLPVEGWAMHAEGGGVKGNIEFFPIEEIQRVAAGLSAHREALKQTIYEITGISDIQRGLGQAYSTATENQLKSQYSIMRLANKQKDVANFVSGLMQLKAFLICKFYDEKRIIERGGLDLSEADKQYVPAALALLKKADLSHFRIEVSVDALQAPDFNTDKQQRSELIMSVSQLLSQALPAAKETPELAPLMGKLLAFGVAGFKGAEAIEGEIHDGLRKLQESQQKKAMNPEPKPPSDAQIAAQDADKDRQFQLQLAEKTNQQKQAELDAKNALEMKKGEGEGLYKKASLDFEKKKHDDEMAIKARQLAIEEQKVNSDKLKTLLSAKEAYAAINFDGTSLAAPGSMGGDQYDQTIRQHMDVLSSDLSNKELATKEDVAVAMQAVSRLEQLLYTLAEQPLPEQTITAQRPDGTTWTAKIH